MFSIRFIALRTCFYHRPCSRYLSCTARHTHNGSSEASVSVGRQTDPSGLGPRRFYTDVDIKRQSNNWYAVLVDGKSVKTGQQSILASPYESLSLALAAEWDAQIGRIRPAAMPLTRLVSTALDVIPEFRGKIIDGIMKYAETDTVCFRANQPESLVRLQDKVLGPIVDWVAERFGVVMPVIKGDLVGMHTAEGLGRLKKWIQDMDDLKLAVLESATASSKSLAVAAAMSEGVLDPSAALRAARSEELWQERVWGTVEGGHDLDSADTMVRLSAADTVLKFTSLAAHSNVFPTSPMKQG